MLFKKYTVYENKLSEKLSDDNPLKQKLINMETPTDHHPVYSFLIFILIAYCLIFYITLISENAYGLFLSTINLLVVIFFIIITYKKNYLTGSNPKYRKNTYIIAIICTILSIWLANKDSTLFSWNEIGYSFLFFQISSKSYIAFAIILYTTLGISLSYYSCPYELYRSFHSANKTYEPQKDEKILINKSFGLAILCCVLIWKIIYNAFNPSHDSFDDLLKKLSIFAICFWIPIFISTYQTKKYTFIFDKALKQQKD